jgi:hypothetical protein
VNQRRLQSIRNPEAFEKAQCVKATKRQTQTEKIAHRLAAIIRDKHSGSLEVFALPHAWILLCEGGALKRSDSHCADVSRQSLVKQALQSAIDNQHIGQHTTTAGTIVLTIPCIAPSSPPEGARFMAVEDCEDLLSRLSGRLFHNLRRWGEAA